MELRHALLPTLAGPLLAVAGPGGLRHLRILAEADTWPLVLTELAAGLVRGAVAVAAAPTAGTDAHAAAAPAPDMTAGMTADMAADMAADTAADTAANAAAAEEGPNLTEDPAHFKPLLRQLGEYFTGERRQFELDLAPRGTAFQQRVWSSLRGIPYGEYRTYSQLAAALGEPRAARAVGQAAAQNPLPILIPCHRLLGNRGHLVGFAGGTDLKARLLRLEGHTLAAGSRVRPPRLF
jgi:methylated-DNA-[protein]-cysteine S-methyltransferase